LPLVGVPQIRIGTLDSIQWHPVQHATIDLLKSGAPVDRPQTGLLQGGGSIGGAAQRTGVDGVERSASPQPGLKALEFQPPTRAQGNIRPAAQHRARAAIAGGMGVPDQNQTSRGMLRDGYCRGVQQLA
jgi:hypothetical protein